MSNDRPLRIAVLLSGSGRTLRNFLDHIEDGSLQAEVALVISSRPDVRGLEIASEAGIAVSTLVPSKYDSAEVFSEAVFAPCREAEVDLMVMAGFMVHVLIPPDFENRVVNIHPGLIPAFCGKGFYGQRVHEAVIEYGAKISGCTIHFADNVYDHGPIIHQSVVPVLDDDTAESLAGRVFEAECREYPKVLQWFAERRVHVSGRRVRVCGAA
ncbi:MAG: phosphoribosylglycinamide formyltransferase [Pirellulales bacterium]|nr:phosphoribosylglycinamide formyltransferase [Pirellulales bacterium]